MLEILRDEVYKLQRLDFRATSRYMAVWCVGLTKGPAMLAKGIQDKFVKAKRQEFIE